MNNQYRKTLDMLLWTESPYDAIKILCSQDRLDAAFQIGHIDRMFYDILAEHMTNG